MGAARSDARAASRLGALRGHGAAPPGSSSAGSRCHRAPRSCGGHLTASHLSLPLRSSLALFSIVEFPHPPPASAASSSSAGLYVQKTPLPALPGARFPGVLAKCSPRIRGAWPPMFPGRCGMRSGTCPARRARRRLLSVLLFLPLCFAGKVHCFFLPFSFPSRKTGKSNRNDKNEGTEAHLGLSTEKGARRCSAVVARCGVLALNPGRGLVSQGHLWGRAAP